MRLSGTIAAFSVQAPANVVPERAQMAATLGFHIILACVGIALPSIVLLAEFTGLRRQDETALLLARRWSQAKGVLIAVGAECISWTCWPRGGVISGAGGLRPRGLRSGRTKPGWVDLACTLHAVYQAPAPQLPSPAAMLGTGARIPGTGRRPAGPATARCGDPPGRPRAVEVRCPMTTTQPEDPGQTVPAAITDPDGLPLAMTHASMNVDVDVDVAAGRLTEAEQAVGWAPGG